MDMVVMQHQRHGKARVRLGRVWRGQDQHVFVEWTITILLESDCLPSYESSDNSTIVATDSIKNTVYALAKLSRTPISVEMFGLQLSSHFLGTYKHVIGVHITIVENAWERVAIGGAPHQHGFKLGPQKRTAEVSVTRDKPIPEVVSGFTDLSLLKTTKSGFEGFVRDKYTLLPEVTERILASTVTAKWRYSKRPPCYTAVYNNVIKLLMETFFGPPTSGVYSPSVQNTLYLIAKKVLESIPDISSIELNMPNLHFLPVNMPSVGAQFEHDVYLPTSEPHGVIEARLTRSSPVSKL